MKKARHKKEKQVEQAQATSAEQHLHEDGSGDGAQPIVIEDHAPVDSREGEKVFSPKKRQFVDSWMPMPNLLESRFNLAQT